MSPDYSRLRVVIETLAYAKPTLPLEEAVSMIFEIENRAIARAKTVAATRMPVTYEPGDLAAWVKAYGHGHKDASGQSIIDNIKSGKKIDAIKGLRTATGVGLREAKEGIEYYVEHYSSTIEE